MSFTEAQCRGYQRTKAVLISTFFFFVSFLRWPTKSFRNKPSRIITAPVLREREREIQISHERPAWIVRTRHLRLDAPSGYKAAGNLRQSRGAVFVRSVFRSRFCTLSLFYLSLSRFLCLSLSRAQMTTGESPFQTFVRGRRTSKLRGLSKILSVQTSVNSTPGEVSYAHTNSRTHTTHFYTCFLMFCSAARPASTEGMRGNNEGSNFVQQQQQQQELCIKR